MRDLSLRLWRLIHGPLQWYLLWVLHAKFMVGVSGILTDGEGRVLLLRHRYWPEGSWGLPGGYARRRERFEESLAREIREETGLEIAVERLISLRSGFLLRVEVTYQGRVTGGTMRLDPREVLDARFFAVDALPDGLLARHRALLEERREVRPDS